MSFCLFLNKVDSLRAWFNLKYVYVLKSLTMTSKKIDCLSWFGWLFAWKSWPRTESVDFSYSFVDLVLNSLTMKQPWKTLGVQALASNPLQAAAVGNVNPDSSHVKSQCRTVLATSNSITCLWHCGMRHRGGRTVIQARWWNVGSRSRNAKGNAESDEQGRNVPKSASVADCPVVVLKCL